MSKLEPDDQYAPTAAKLANVIAQKVGAGPSLCRVLFAVLISAAGCWFES
jgi:hypothetical protein